MILTGHINYTYMHIYTGIYQDMYIDWASGEGDVSKSRRIDIIAGTAFRICELTVYGWTMKAGNSTQLLSRITSSQSTTTITNPPKAPAQKKFPPIPNPTSPSHTLQPPTTNKSLTNPSQLTRHQPRSPHHNHAAPLHHRRAPETPLRAILAN